MINVGHLNRWALIQLLKEDFEEKLRKIPHMMVHNFSTAAPTFKLTLEVDAEKFHRLVLQKEVQDLTKKLERLQKHNSQEQLETETEQNNAR